MQIIDVAVGVILRGDKVFICKRPAHLHQGDKWEFPGGKAEPNEAICDTLARELREEIGIQVLDQTPLMVIEHDYGDKVVRLDIRIVTQFTGEPHGEEGQESCWALLSELHQLTFPEANKPIIDTLLSQIK